MPLVRGAEVRLRSIYMLSTKLYKMPVAYTLLMLLLLSNLLLARAVEVGEPESYDQCKVLPKGLSNQFFHRFTVF